MYDSLARFDLGKYFIAGSKIFCYIVGAGHAQNSFRIPYPIHLFCLRQLCPLLFIETDEIPGSGQADGPHSGISAFLNPAHLQQTV